MRNSKKTEFDPSRSRTESDTPDAMTKRRAQAEQTRTGILDAAEESFSRAGFERTRLEDVARAVGVRRGAIFHYFRGKRELYEAVLYRLAESLMLKLREALAERESLPDQIETALLTWIDFAAERPAFGRLVLRIAADASDADRPAVERFAGPFLTLLEQTIERGEREGILKPITREPLQLASTIAGSTVFFLAAMPALIPTDREFDPHSPESFEAYRRDALLIARRLAGIPEREKLASDSDAADEKEPSAASISGESRND
jgi:AcrR family transcriptional regulator